MTRGQEFQALVDCCRWTFSGEATPFPRIEDNGFDWALFLHLARRHRVQPLVWRSLSQSSGVPTDIADALAVDTAGIARQNLQAALESQRLAALFGDAGIPLLFVKGLTLSAIAYGDPFLKMGKDIDLLIPERQVAQAATLLSRAGYEVVEPAGPADELSLIRWHASHKESAWVNRAGRSHIDLHSRLAENQALIPGVSVLSGSVPVRIGEGIDLSTLPPDELFAYLCVHGASSAWFRLKWITDLAALLHGKTEDEVADLYESSQRLGAGRAAAQALLLLHHLYGFGPRPELRSRLASDSANRLLLRLALFYLEGPLGRREPTEVPLGTVAIHLSQPLLLPGWNFKLGEIRRQFRRAARTG